MAGIGFELKKLFAGRGVVMKVRAYAYASIVCTGTMLLAIVLLLGVQSIAKAYGVAEAERNQLVVMMVYAMLFSLLLCSGFQMLLS
ncbi:MAG: exopolysaccharide Pel transporter PelG, partial [Clostridia bacterium]